MIIATGKAGEKELILFGLTRENVARLMAGEPIKMTRESHGNGIPTNASFIIIFGETEAALGKMFAKAGILNPSARVHVNPNLQ